uniref:Exostosin GT47 domain-containing protein n=1 Tax=Chaetoceros debilis TaxID=122233 RepID=A0A7S3Q241_9STRA
MNQIQNKRNVDRQDESNGSPKSGNFEHVQSTSASTVKSKSLQKQKKSWFIIKVLIALFAWAILFISTSSKYTTRADTSLPFFDEYSAQEDQIPRLEEETMLSATVAGLEKGNIYFYMYDHPNITMAGNVWDIRPRYRNFRTLDGANEEQMLEALAESPLRTFNMSKADLFIPPIPMAKILCSSGGNFNLPMQTLSEQETFKKHKGNKHVLISTTFSLYRQNYRSFTGMKPWYDRMYNMTVVQSWDPVSYHNALLHHKTLEWGDYQSNGVVDPSLSRRSVSVGLGANNNSLKLCLASVDKFHNSSNFVFYQSQTGPSVNNSTIYRHAPMTIVQDNGSFPKSSIGWGLVPEAWHSEFTSSKFCLNIRGDSSHSHALWRSIRVGCIPVIVSNQLPVYAPMFKSTLNMSDYAVMLDEKDLLNDPRKALLKLDNMTEDEIRVKIKHLAFAQRVIFTDHPRSLFVPAFLKEAVLAPEVL